MSHFNIKCRHCGVSLKDVYCAFCEHCRNALLVSDYHDAKLTETGKDGLWRFNWLPVHAPDFAQPGPVVYKSSGLAGYLGLENLYIAFNGYWPDMNALVQTCTFKEYEAAAVLQNARENGMPGLTVASAGNTARAFAHLSTTSGFPVIIVVPRMCLSEMWYIESHLRIPTLVVGDGDYADAIDIAGRVAPLADMPFEGGTKNIAKRDGLGSVMLQAAYGIGRMPDRYFQAVGSGAGAVGVWEMSERLLADGRFGAKLPELHLAQNLPFVPMVRAWDAGSRALFEEDLRPELIGEITTRVLSSRYPAFGIEGGVFDALTATNGKMYSVKNEEVFKAQDIFLEKEGIDIVPAAGVAVAALIQSASSVNARKSDILLLNITGGGEKKFRSGHTVHEVEAHFVSKNITDRAIEEVLCKVLNKD